MNAFITSTRLQLFRFQQGEQRWRQNTCERQRGSATIWMKTKSGNDKRSKRKAVSSGSGTTGGFGKKAVNEGGGKTATKKSTAQNEKSSDIEVDEEVEESSGEAGDSTPHRVKVTNNPVEKLVNPTEKLREQEPEPLVALPILSEEELREMRFDYSTPIDELIEQFSEAVQRDDFDSIIVANRHLISETLLYRLTNMILRTESEIPSRTAATPVKKRRSVFGFNFNTNYEPIEEDDDDDDEFNNNNNESIKPAETDLEDDCPEAKQIRQKANGLRQLRKTLVAYAWSYDYAFKRAILLAESRLLKVLQSDDVKKDMELNCGRSTLEVNSFWTVIYAAVVAWEERGKENEKLVNVDTQRVLTEAAEACRSSDAVLSRLSECLKNVQQILVTTTANDQIEVVDKMEEETLFELIAYTEACRLLPWQAYGGLVNRLSSIVDYVRSTKFGLDPVELTPIEFEPARVQRKSRLIEFLEKIGSTRSI